MAVILEIIQLFEDKCVGCNKCIGKCPVEQANSCHIKDGKNVVHINSDRCIVCGNCIEVCDHDARGYRDDTEIFFADLNKGQKISVIVAPSIGYNLENYKNLFGFLKSKGVDLIYDVSFGAEMTIWAYLKVIKQQNLESMIAQPCPAIVLFIEKYCPELIEYLAPIHSPALCTAVYLKKYKQVGDKIAFLSPCMGKAEEFRDTSGYVNYNVTYKKLDQYIRENHINLADFPIQEFDDHGCGLGLTFSRPGGLSENIDYHTNHEAWVRQVEGDQSYKYLQEYAKRTKNGKKLPLLVDILNCNHGCNIGTGTCKNIEIDDIDAAMNKRKIEKMQQVSNDEGHKEDYALFEQFDKELKLEDFIRKYRDKSSFIDKTVFSEKEYSEIFSKMHKLFDIDRTINCFACGYGNCRSFARAVLLGNNHLDNCINFNRAEVDIEKQQVQAKGEVIGDLQNMIDEIQQLNYELENSKSDLVAREQENQAILSAIPDLMFVMNAAGTILEVREGTFKTVFSTKGLVGKNITELAGEEDICLVMESILGALEDGDVKTFEYLLPAKGQNAYREFRFVAAGNDKVLVLVKDISERKQMEESIKETSSRQRLLNEVLGILYDPLNWQDSFRLACEKIARFTGVSGVYIFEESLENVGHADNFYAWSHQGVISEEKSEGWFEAVYQWRELVKTNGYLYIADAETNWPSELSKLKETVMLKSVLAFPLCVTSQINGHLAFIETENKRWETEKEMEEFCSLSDLLLFIISGALERKRSQEELVIARQNTERKNEKIALLFTDVQRNMAAVTNLLNNTGQGILSFGSELSISTEYSSECHRIFNGDVGGQNIIELLFAHDPEKEVYGDIFREVFKQGNLCRQSVLLTLLPEQISIDENVFSIDYKIIRESLDTSQQRIMVIMTDITEKNALEEQIEQERELQNTMVRVVEQYDSFMEIIEDFKRLLEDLEKSTELPAGGEEKWKEDLYRQVHTFKGSFSMFGLQHLTRKLHELEDYIANENNIELLKRELVGTQLTALHQVYSAEWNKLVEVLGQNFFKRAEYVQVESKRIASLENMLLGTEVAKQMPRVFDELRRWRYKKISELILQYKNYVVELGLRMDKKIHPLTICGAEVLVDPRQYKEILYNLVHIFRNMVDHGIESPEERSSNDKDEYGNITCEISLENDGLYLEISDDGKGIDVEKIRQKSVESGMISRADMEQMDETEIIQLVFESGFSTRGVVSDVSGRGMGLIAIKRVVEKIGGQVTVRSQLGIGTTFRFSLGNAYLVKQ